MAPGYRRESRRTAGPGGIGTTALARVATFHCSRRRGRRWYLAGAQPAWIVRGRHQSFRRGPRRPARVAWAVGRGGTETHVRAESALSSGRDERTAVQRL